MWLMQFDIVIAGGGPAGLGFARALAGSGLSIAIVEKQKREALAAPRYDGREIALTHRSIRSLADLGAWSKIPAPGISPLKEARVLNGASPLALRFDTGDHPEQSLGMLVANNLIRQSLFEAVQEQANVTLIADTAVKEVRVTLEGTSVELSDGGRLTGRLLVAADSRFSSIRGALGIKAEMNRMGMAMLVCRVEHECDHAHVATEWFSRGQTFAMLPLNGKQSSAVLTVTQDEAERIAALDDDSLGLELSARYSYRLGAMRVTSSRHVYPLVTTYAERFVTTSAALIGDTAVGMHPVTAHGFNLGLASAMTLAEEIKRARRQRMDWADQIVLRRFEFRHRRASLPIYRATNLIVRLYGDDRLPARIARNAGIRLGRKMPAVSGAVRSMLLRA